MKYIVVMTHGGFGNKIFDIMIALYVQHVNGGKIYVHNKKTHHDIINDKQIIDIFPNLSSKITIVNDQNEIFNIENKVPEKKRTTINCNNINSVDDFVVDKKYEYIWITKKVVCYKYMYDICHILKQNYDDLFEINTNVISENTLDVVKNDYMIIHIRYGDKLEMASKGQNGWVVYTPGFYKKMIQKYSKKIKIYIITDDIEIVKHFILNDVKHCDVELLDIPWWDAFYCIVKSKYTILNISTFSMLGSLLNDNLKKGFIVTRSTDPKLLRNNKTPEEDIIPNTKWVIINDDKHILNHNRHLMKKMLWFKKNNTS
jgi:hypothetical protein